MFRMFPRKLQKLFTVQAYQELALKTSRLLDSLGVYDDDIGHRLVILHFLIRKRRRSCIHRARFLHVWYALESLTALLAVATRKQYISWFVGYHATSHFWWGCNSAARNLKGIFIIRFLVGRIFCWNILYRCVALLFSYLTKLDQVW